MITKHIVILCSCWLLACGAKNETKPEAPERPDAAYDVRGRIESIIEGQGPDTLVQIAHEAMPDFKDRDGNPSPMHAMTMPFALDPRVARDTLKPKSLYQFHIEIHWSHAPGMRIVSATPLPPDTPLTLATH